MRLFWALAAPVRPHIRPPLESPIARSFRRNYRPFTNTLYEASSFNRHFARQRLIVFSAARVWELGCPIATAGSVRRVSVRRLARPRRPARPRTVLRRLVASLAAASLRSPGHPPSVIRTEPSEARRRLFRKDKRTRPGPQAAPPTHLPCACGDAEARIRGGAKTARAYSAHAHRESVFSRLDCILTPHTRDASGVATSLRSARPVDGAGSSHDKRNILEYIYLAILSLNKYLIKRAARHTI